MLILIFRIGIGVVILILALLNTVYPAFFRPDLPLFWMFRGGKIRKKYKEDFQRLQEKETENRLIDELEERTNRLNKGE